MSKSALIMTCPLCGTVNDHPVLRTLPRVRPITGLGSIRVQQSTGQSAGYRIRERRCGDCKVTFESVELPRETFDAFLSECERAINREVKIALQLKDALTAFSSFAEYLSPDTLRRFVEKLHKRLEQPRKPK